jgi:hypothetical protein
MLRNAYDLSELEADGSNGYHRLGYSALFVFGKRHGQP